MILRRRKKRTKITNWKLALMMGIMTRTTTMDVVQKREDVGIEDKIVTDTGFSALTVYSKKYDGSYNSSRIYRDQEWIAGIETMLGIKIVIDIETMKEIETMMGIVVDDEIGSG